jgi:hypothetical protein
MVLLLRQNFNVMKKVLVAIIVLYCLAGHLTAQSLKFVSAVEDGTVHGPGKALPRNAHPKYTYDIHYTITLSYENLKSIVLDSLYLGNITTRLFINDNLKIDNINHTCTIRIHSYTSTDDIRPVSGRETERRTIASNLIIYKYKGKKYILPFSGFTVGHLSLPC